MSRAMRATGSHQHAREMRRWGENQLAWAKVYERAWDAYADALRTEKTEDECNEILSQIIREAGPR